MILRFQLTSVFVWQMIHFRSVTRYSLYFLCFCQQRKTNRWKWLLRMKCKWYISTFHSSNHRIDWIYFPLSHESRPSPSTEWNSTTNETKERTKRETKMNLNMFFIDFQYYNHQYSTTRLLRIIVGCVLLNNNGSSVESWISHVFQLISSY